MEKFCIFCGRQPKAKNKEHVIPRWLIEATGDPKRIASFGMHYPGDPKPRRFSFDQLTFPACEVCNGKFSRLEVLAKPVVMGVLNEDPLSEQNFTILLDWLDKVRVGLWLGLLQLTGNPGGITPSYHIVQRLAARDRSVGICRITGRGPGITFVGPESPCFTHYPTTMALLINRVCLFNCSALDLCSRRLGFPFPKKFRLRADGFMQLSMTAGLERILKPIERTGDLQSFPFLYQPILMRGLSNESNLESLYDTEYVRRNVIDFDVGIGGIFLQKATVVMRYPANPSKQWLPGNELPLREAHRVGRRWVYKKLENGLAREHGGTSGLPPFRSIHNALIASYDEAVG